ncbi:Acyl-coenzyme A thioesterase 11 [Boothiomyces sp. JEL0866]|nr:Acyl-coenzyme A thioesterase 11 [Boothiomyces sp. JEL0866]
MMVIGVNKDILRVRISTKEISETRYEINGGLIVYDVGGQRGLRKQWMPFFDMVHTIVFVTDISSYDQTLVENPTANRLKDAIELFGKISNSHLLLHVNIVLLLNKMDLFERKLAHIPVQHYFPSYQDSQEPAKVVKFFEKQFLKQCKRTRADGNVIIHPTKCTDTKSMQILDVRNSILNYTSDYPILNALISLYFSLISSVISTVFFWVPTFLRPNTNKYEVQSKESLKTTMTQLIRSVHTDSRDICAGISARRHAGTTCITVAVDAVHFVAPVKLNHICILKASLTRSWQTSMEVSVTVETEDMLTGEITFCCSGFFTFMTSDRRPVPMITPNSMRERRRYHEAQERRNNRLAKKTYTPNPCLPYSPKGQEEEQEERGTMKAFRKHSFTESRVRSNTLDLSKVAVNCSDTYTEVVEIVFPEHCNSMGITFGGQIMQWMEYCAAIAANRHCRGLLLVASIDSITFLKSTRQGDVVTVRAMVSASYTHSVEVYVTVEKEDLAGNQVVTNDGWLTLVMYKNGSKCRVPQVNPVSSWEIERQKGSAERKEQRLKDKQLIKSYIHQ